VTGGPRSLWVAVAAGAAFALLACPVHAAEAGKRIVVTVTDDAPTRLARSYGQKPFRLRHRYAVSARARSLASELAREYGLLLVEGWRIDSLGVYCVVYRPDGDTRAKDVLPRLRADPRVDMAQPLQAFRTLGSGAYNDPYVAMQHGLAELGIEAAHRLVRGAGVRVAIIDSAVDIGHEDLSHAVAENHDFITGSRRILPGEQHGTAVAGVIAAAANNARGIVGVAPAASIITLRACWHARAGEPDICDSFTLAKALDALIAIDADVANLSFGGPTDPLLSRMLHIAMDSGTLVVTAMPDDGTAGFPANVPGVITVQSNGTEDARLPASMSAPGEYVLTSVPGDRYDFRSGSSLAAAHVTGVLALLHSRRAGFAKADLERLLQSQSPVAANACLLLAALGEPVSCGPQSLAELPAR